MGKKVTKGGRGKKASGSGPLTAQKLYEQAQLSMQYEDFDAARTALKKAAKMEPSNIEIVEALGALLSEIGPENEAIQVSHSRQLPCV
jgi:kinesin family protein 5